MTEYTRLGDMGNGDQGQPPRRGRFIPQPPPASRPPVQGRPVSPAAPAAPQPYPPTSDQTVQMPPQPPQPPVQQPRPAPAPVSPAPVSPGPVRQQPWPPQQQFQQGPPQQQHFQQQGQPGTPNQSIGFVAVICAALSALCCAAWGVGIFPAVVGIVLAVAAKRDYLANGVHVPATIKATYWIAGIAIVLNIIGFFISLAGWMALPNMSPGMDSGY